MHLKISLLLVLSLFSFYTQAEPLQANQLRIQNKTINELGDSSVAINGPIYIVSNRSVATVNFPNLEYVNGPIYIVNNLKLTKVYFPKLKFVNGPIYVSYNSSLKVINFYRDMYVNGPVYYYMNKNE